MLAFQQSDDFAVFGELRRLSDLQPFIERLAGLLLQILNHRLHGFFGRLRHERTPVNGCVGASDSSNLIAESFLTRFRQKKLRFAFFSTRRSTPSATLPA